MFLFLGGSYSLFKDIVLTQVKATCGVLDTHLILCTSMLLMFGEICKDYRAEANVKTEDRKKEDTGLMESTVRGRDRERETHRKLYFKIMHSLNVHVCVFNGHFYTGPLKD